MRIALKAVANNPSTPDAPSSKASGGGSFLDILSQGTQDAVQGTKAATSQAHSDESRDGESASDGQTSQNASQSSATKTSSTSGDSISQKQATPAAATTNPAGSPKNVSSTSATVPSNQAKDPAADVVKADPKYLFAADIGVFAAADSTQTTSTDTSSSSAAAAGKQTGTTKTPQGKQAATQASATADASVLLQALAALPQPVTPIAVPQGTQAQPVVPSAMQSAVGGVGGDGNDQTQVPAALPASAQLAQPNGESVVANAPPSSQGQQDNSGTTPAQTPPFSHDLVASAAIAAKAAAGSLPAISSNTIDANNGAAGSGAAPTQTSDQTSPSQAVANTFFSATTAQNDNAATQTSAKAIPFKVAGTNLAANTYPAGSIAASNTNAHPTAVSATATRNASQDSSNSSRNGQDGDSASGTQSGTAQQPTNDIRTDASAQPFVLQAATGHTTTQTGSSTAAPDSTPSHVSEARSLPADPTHASVQAGSSAINTARVIQNMNETEMRVGMRSTEFGDISIRTMVNQQQMQTQISVDHSELVSALTAHIPSVQAKIGAEYGLHASIEVSQGGASFSNQQQQSSQRDYKPFVPSMQFDGAAAPAETERIIARPVTASLVAEGSRLDIRA